MSMNCWIQLRIMKRMNSDPQLEAIINKLSRRYCILFYLSIEEYELTNTIDAAILWSKLNKISRTNIKIDHLSNNFINQLRFNNQEQLRSLIRAFQFPDLFRAKNGLRFTADEVLLCGLYRLHYPNRFIDVGWVQIFGFDYNTASACFNCSVASCSIIGDIFYLTISDSGSLICMVIAWRYMPS
jgi:hypothetical protein